MALPSKLKNMGMFNDGYTYMGKAKTVTLPKLGRKFESMRAAGMNGPVKIDFGMSDDGIQIEWTLGGLDLITLRQWGMTKINGVQLRWAGAFEQDDTEEVTSVEIVAHGRHEEIDFGDAEAGEDTEHKIVTVCTYYKLVVNGNTEIEIDLLNFVETVNGVDRLAEQRKAIGL